MFRYGSILMAVTLCPRDLSSTPVDEAMIPLPTPEITPPVTTMYFIDFPACCSSWMAAIIIAISVGFCCAPGFNRDQPRAAEGRLHRGPLKCRAARDLQAGHPTTRSTKAQLREAEMGTFYWRPTLPRTNGFVKKLIGPDPLRGRGSISLSRFTCSVSVLSAPAPISGQTHPSSSFQPKILATRYQHTPTPWATI